MHMATLYQILCAIPVGGLYYMQGFPLTYAHDNPLPDFTCRSFHGLKDMWVSTVYLSRTAIAKHNTSGTTNLKKMVTYYRQVVFIVIIYLYYRCALIRVKSVFGHMLCSHVHKQQDKLWCTLILIHTPLTTCNYLTSERIHLHCQAVIQKNAGSISTVHGTTEHAQN